ncbi:tetratricopeptide repeat protein [Roseibacterium sp. SDUM158016]|uniref:tetratricopeptide repeat protein n=1 Tax=Roseicyclus sediminis TaxID=2980997 RepID=UPI0021D0A51F|nr:tetratricopeptide repeat protein [Roseibacterium sp. SDUM158016]MCU4653835.1 tetratricopeptide repeat protein [Roseibacterium sp. SDUM158016]
MSTVEKVGTQVGNTCVGAFALILGDASGGALVAQGLVGLAAIGAAVRGDSARRACTSAREKTIAALKADPEFRHVNPDRLVVLLSSETTVFNRADLVAASEAAADLDLDAALARAIHATLPFDGDDAATVRLLLLALEAGMRACNQDKAFKQEVQAVQILHILQEMSATRTTGEDTNARVRDLERKVESLLAALEADRPRLSPFAQTLLENESFIVALAFRYAEGSTGDFDAALRGLERAVEVAAEARARGQLPANTDDAVNDVIARVDALNDEGRIDSAAELLAEEEARVEAGLLRLYDKGIAQAILTRDADAACAYELKKLPLEVPDPAAQFEALRAVWGTWYERGRDRGLNFDLEVSVAIARACLSRAADADQRGYAGNYLGISLQTLGEREAGTERLEQAVAAYEAALEERTRDRVPLDWATTQMNLGTALQTLGQRETGTERLEQAVAACEAALEEWTRDRVPLDWAMTQMNLGNALATLGQRETGTGRLEQAVAAYEAALEEWTRDRVPLDWAMTQMNLGNALQTLGQRETGTERLEQAVAAYKAALEERTRDRLPLDWATTQNNLGNALATLGERETGTERLEQAVAAYEAALEEYTRDRVPLDWANTRGNEALALLVLAARREDVALAVRARDQLAEAEAVLRDGGHVAWADTFARQLPAADAIIARLGGG